MACYNLDEVRKLAKQGAVEYMGRTASRDAAELGYSLNDVIRCLAALTEDEFSKSLEYGAGLKHDVYITKFPRHNG